jgi:hypothetical protein
MIVMTTIRAKRENQRDRYQIMVPTGSIIFIFFTPMELYFDLKNIVVMKCPNA